MWLYLGDALALLALASMTAAVVGITRGRDVYVRVRAASQGVLLGVLPLVVTLCLTGNGAVAARGVLLLAVLLFTTTISSHAVGRLEFLREQRGRAGDEEREREQA
ncbi:MAG: monovalent cation/H(+) antiporter subunit G [Vicinamibacterales bacterium]